jgi:hypothetical protein
MRNSTRELFDAYLERQAELNHINKSHVTKSFSIDPSVEQTLEDKVQQSSEMLKLINIYGVNDQSGEKIGLGVSGPIPAPTIPPPIAASLFPSRRWIRTSTPVIR